MLPDHMRLSDDELAIVARLVRVLRIRTYWLGAYIEWLLEAEAETTDAVDVAEAIKVLEDIKGLNSWANWFESARSKRRSILRYYGHRYFEDDVHRMTGWGIDLPDADKEQQFQSLVEMWRADYPEPPQRPRHPSGHLDRATDDD